MQVRLAVACAVVLAVAGGCEDTGVRTPCTPLEAEPVDPAGAHYQYVVDSIDMPSSVSEAKRLGLDLDDDPEGRANNALGQIANTLFRFADLDPDDEVNALIRAGAILHLLDLQTVSLEDAAGVGLTLKHGVDVDGDAGDNFSGVEALAVDVSRGNGTVSGAVTEGQLSASVGTLPVAVSFPGLGEPFILHLVGAKAEVTVGAGTMAGRIGGGVTAEEIDRVLFPVLAEGFNRVTDDDCDDTGCVEGTAGETLIDLFDSNGDFHIDVDELRDNDLASSLLAPDLDLFDETGALNPRCDGIRDSLSVGIGFTAVPAVVVPNLHPTQSRPESVRAGN